MGLCVFFRAAIPSTSKPHPPSPTPPTLANRAEDQVIQASKPAPPNGAGWWMLQHSNPTPAKRAAGWASPPNSCHFILVFLSLLLEWLLATGICWWGGGGGCKSLARRDVTEKRKVLGLSPQKMVKTMLWTHFWMWADGVIERKMALIIVPSVLVWEGGFSLGGRWTLSNLGYDGLTKGVF